jgi:hypothetical protein
VEWTSIYQLFWCSPGVQGFDPSPYVILLGFPDDSSQDKSSHCLSLNGMGMNCIRPPLPLFSPHENSYPSADQPGNHGLKGPHKPDLESKRQSRIPLGQRYNVMPTWLWVGNHIWTSSIMFD